MAVVVCLRVDTSGVFIKPDTLWPLICHVIQSDNFSIISTDLQLAAELGKTLLQRNKELERNLTTYQDLAEDQALEIDASAV